MISHRAPCTGASLASRTFAQLLVTLFLFGMGASSLLLLPRIMTEFWAATPSQVGASGAVFALAGIVSTPLVAWLEPRVGNRGLLLAGNLLGVAAVFSCSQVSAVDASLYVVRGTHGVAWALVLAGGVSLTAETAPPGRLGQALGLCSGANLVTNALSPALLEPLLPTGGPSVVFLVATSVGALGLVSSLLQRRGERAAVATHAPAAETRDRTGTGHWIWPVVSMAAGACVGVVFAFQQPYARSVGASEVRLFLLGFVFGAISVRLLGGRLADWIGYKTMTIVALVGYGLALLGILLAGADSLWSTGICFGLAHGIFFPSALALQVSMGRPRASAAAGVNAWMSIGGISMPLIGHVAETRGYAPVFLAGAACAGGVALIACFTSRVAARRESSRDSSRCRDMRHWMTENDSVLLEASMCDGSNRSIARTSNS